MTGQTQVKKVKPFPFKASLKDARGVFMGQIVKMTIQGLMIEVPGTAVQPGEKVEVNFVTPILNGVVVLAGVVVKVYNQLSGMTGAPVTEAPPTATGAPLSTLLVEVHYRSVPPDSMGRIAQFLEKIGQAKS